ncbi:MAG: CCA tRNA nucleotidyltransferase [Clostridia bacterium]|nr:CCA tRNA nucleotidyltransferase [Clostridia bacterium]MBQ8859672.1 CCA tRNA nucleotidyltransferase [Clostridia bacterium]
MEAERFVTFDLPPAVREIMARLDRAGYEVFLVGGCVRDMLRGTTPGDYDMTTSATPEEMHSVFAGYRTVDTGIRHGTVTVIVDGTPFEITTYRVDGDYRDSRHPTEVRYTASLQEDVARRDFTVNAIAYHPEKGLCDYFGGCEDLEKRVLRAVGDPRRRFREDALRILRALRFSATLGFLLEEETAAAAREAAPLLLRVSAERVREELTKLLLGDHASAVLSEFADILAVLFPRWYEWLLAGDDPAEHALSRLGAWLSHVPKTPVARYTVFLSPFVRTEQAAAQMDALRFDHRTRDRVTKLLSHRNDPCHANIRAARRFLSSLGGEDALLLLDIRRSARLVDGESGEEQVLAKSIVRALLEEEGECSSVSDLAVRGGDLIALGFSAGKELGLTLRALLAAVADGRVKNEKTALLAYAQDELK